MVWSKSDDGGSLITGYQLIDYDIERFVKFCGARSDMENLPDMYLRFASVKLALTLTLLAVSKLEIDNQEPQPRLATVKGHRTTFRE